MASQHLYAINVAVLLLLYEERSRVYLANTHGTSMRLKDLPLARAVRVSPLYRVNER